MLGLAIYVDEWTKRKVRTHHSCNPASSLEYRGNGPKMSLNIEDVNVHFARDVVLGLELVMDHQRFVYSFKSF